MITVADAVREFGGKWQSRKSMLVTHDDGSYEFRDSAGHIIVCTRSEFRAEARRQGYAIGFEGEWDGTGYPPPDTKCEFKAVTRDGVFSHNNFADDYEPCTIKYASENGCHLIDRDGAECFMDSLDYMITFRFLKSDRERWCEAARDKGFKAGPAGRMYDALKSGELPMPEKD